MNSLHFRQRKLLFPDPVIAVLLHHLFDRIDPTMLRGTVVAVTIATYLLITWAMDAKQNGPLDPRPSTFFVPPTEPVRPRARW